MSRLLFVCMTNRCISQLASSFVRSRLKELNRLDDFDISSAGLRVHKGDDVPRETRDAMLSFGIEPMAYFPRQISLKEIRSADLIICMSHECCKKLSSSYRSAEGKVIHLMGLIGSAEDVFEPRRAIEPNKHCLTMMKPALEKLIERLL